MDIDILWERAEKYARNFALRNFTDLDYRKVELLRNNIFEYYRKRDLKLDYFELSADNSSRYCFLCLAYMPKFHFC